MNSFQFSCESLLSIRQHYVETAEAELGQAVTLVAKLESQVSMVNERRRAFQAERRSLQMGQQFDVSLAARADRVGDQWRFELIHTQQQLEVARGRLDEVRDACHAARAALESLEQLKCRHALVVECRKDRANRITEVGNIPLKE